jgi:hypothetical protein
MTTRDTTTTHQPRARAEKLIVLAFLLAICLPAATLVVPTRGSRMKRALGEARVAFPVVQLTYRSLAAFPAGFREYFQANFGGRKALIRYHGKLKTAVGLSASPRVIVGWRGWLYYADEREADCCRNAIPMTGKELESWRQTIEARRDWLAARGIRFLFVVPPDKHAIYPEYLPPNMRPIRKESRLDQLLTYLHEHSTADTLDLRPALWQAKRDGQIYCKLDTHWNALGAFVAHREIVRSLRKWFPDIPVPELDLARVSKEERTGGDLARMLGLGSDLKDIYPVVNADPPQATIVTGAGEEIRDPSALIEVIVSERRNAPIPRGVILRDSFCTDLLPLLSEDFGRAAYLWGSELDPQKVLPERPQIVIWELVERLLMKPPPDPAIGPIPSEHEADSSDKLG